MKKRIFTIVASILLLSSLLPSQAFASNNLTTPSDHALTAFTLSHDTSAIVDLLENKKIEPVLQDNVSFSLSCPSNTISRALNNTSLCDVRLVTTIDNFDIYQATYIAGVNLEDMTQEYIDGMRVSFSILYAVRQYDGYNYNRILNSRLQILSSTSGNYIDEYQLNFNALGYGFANETSTDPGTPIHYRDISATGGPLYVGNGVVRYNTHTGYVAETFMEGVRATAPIITNLGSGYEFEIRLGLGEL